MLGRGARALIVRCLSFDRAGYDAVMAPQKSQKKPVQMADDGRYVVVDGRRWRATDPSIPDGLRAELVSELMSARRAVKSAASESETAAARRRVHDAKVALGERGVAWWKEPDEPARRSRIVATMRAMLRSRNPDATVCPSDVARIVGGQAWRGSMDEVRGIAAELVTDGVVEIRQGGRAVPEDADIVGPIRIGRGTRFDRRTTRLWQGS